MKYESQEELIGAYLDGELSPSEQIRVEQLLDDHAEYRQLYEELRALRHSLQSLPRHQLGEDMSPRVLRLAEHEMLLGARSPEKGPRNGELTVELAEESPDADRMGHQFSWRTWFWPCVTIAAALMIMVANWNDKHANHVASTRQKAVGSIEATPPDKLQKPPRENDSAVAKDGALPGKGDQHQATDAQDREFALDKGQPPQTPENAAPTTVAKEDRQSPAHETAADKPGDTRLASVSPTNQGPGHPLSPAESPISFAQGVLLVKCDLRAEAVRNKTFQKLLSDEHIAWRDPEQDAAPASKDPTQDDATDKDAVEQPGDEAVATVTLPETAIYVEATTRQVRNVLFQLMERSDEFAGVETRPQRGVAAERVFLVYNRHNPAADIAGAPPAVVKSGTAEGVNARALPNLFSGSKPGKLGLDLDKPDAVHAPEPTQAPKPANRPADKKPTHATNPKAQNQPGATAGKHEEDSLASHDDEPVRVLFMLRLVDARGKPVPESP